MDTVPEIGENVLMNNTNEPTWKKALDQTKIGGNPTKAIALAILALAEAVDEVAQAIRDHDNAR